MNKIMLVLEHNSCFTKYLYIIMYTHTREIGEVKSAIHVYKFLHLRDGAIKVASVSSPYKIKILK